MYSYDDLINHFSDNESVKQALIEAKDYPSYFNQEPQDTLADVLWEAFNWHKSPLGVDFWGELWNKLRD